MSFADSRLRLSQRPDALFLDAGDTLIFFDSQAVAAELDALGERVDPARLDAALHAAKRAYQASLRSGRSHEDGWSILVTSILTGAGVPPSRASEVLPALRRSHDDFYFWRKLQPDLLSALERARAAKLRLGIISNSEGRLVPVLERIGIAHHFEQILDSHLEGVQKPEPEIFHRALQRFGVAPERSVYAGDIPEVDVDGSERVGMRGVLIDAFDLYAECTDIPRFASVGALIDALLALPARRDP